MSESILFLKALCLSKIILSYFPLSNEFPNTCFEFLKMYRILSFSTNRTFLNHYRLIHSYFAVLQFVDYSPTTKNYILDVLFCRIVTAGF